MLRPELTVDNSVIDCLGSDIFPQSFCGHRWLENGTVLERAIRLLPKIREFIAEVGDNCPDTVSLLNVKEGLNDPLLVGLLSDTVMPDV